MSSCALAPIITSFGNAAGLGLLVLGLLIIACRIAKTAGEGMEMARVQKI